MSSINNLLINITLACMISIVLVSTALGAMIILENNQEEVAITETISPVLVQPQTTQSALSSQKKEVTPSVPTVLEPVISTTKSSSKPKVVKSPSSGSSSNVQPSQPEPITTSVIGSAPPIIPANANEQEKLQFILDSRPEHFSLPKDTAVLITFFDRSDGYLISGWKIVPFTGQDYDLKLTFGDYYIDSLMSDFCGTAKKIRDLQDYSWRLNKDTLSLLLKYGSLMMLKNTCD